MEIGIELYAEIMKVSLPIGIAFAIGDFMVATFLGMMLRGKMRLGG